MVKYFIFTFILVTNIYAYKDMSKVDRRASNLDMTVENYTNAMAIAGVFTGSMFGLFLWKSK